MPESKPQYRVLIAEDDAFMRKSIADYLTGCGYEVHEAEDGSVAMRLLHELKPDILLSDLRMPGIDGIELIRQSLSEPEPVPVIIISGMGTIQDAVEALRIGAFDYIIKPIHDMAIIQYSVKKAIRHAELMKVERRSRMELEEIVHQRTQELLLQNRQLEEEMDKRRVQEELVLHAKQQWERTVDAMPEMIAIIDKNHRILRMNRPMRERFGRSYTEIMEKPCFFWMHCREKPHERCPHDQTVADGLPHKEVFYEEHLDSYLEVTTIPYTDADGSLIGSVHIARDITEQKKAEKQKEKLQAQLLHAQKLESVGQLAAGIAHEINTPTQFIASNIDFIEEATEDIALCIQNLETIADNAPAAIGDSIRKALADMDWEFLSEELPQAISQTRDGIRRVSSIVLAMREFSHPGSKEKEIQNLNRIIDTTVTVARNEWKYVAEVELDLDPYLPSIPLLADDMGQVILNMLVNASHAIGEKLGANPTGTKGSITIITRKETDGVELRIRDSGTGIPEAVRPRIFDPFYTTKEVGKGTGQGLAIVHDIIIEKHGGTIDFISEPQKGTEFIITLPLTDSGNGKTRRNTNS